MRTVGASGRDSLGEHGEWMDSEEFVAKSVDNWFQRFGWEGN